MHMFWRACILLIGMLPQKGSEATDPDCFHLVIFLSSKSSPHSRTPLMIGHLFRNGIKTNSLASCHSFLNQRRF